MRSLRRTHIILLAGIGLRVAIWLLLPPDRFASDERSYYAAGAWLALHGVQDTFWPPVTGWIIALLLQIVDPAEIRWLRLFWVALDLAVLLVLRAIAATIAAEYLPAYSRLPLPDLVSIGYVLYLPAITFSQFMTSETPAALLLLCIVLLLLRGQRRPLLVSSLAGLLAGLLVLTRSNLAGVVVCLSVVLVLLVPPAARRQRLAGSLLFLGGALLIAGGWSVSNYARYGSFFLSQNAAYNLYLGNNPVYLEDLNLFAPWATPAQIESRQRRLAGEAEPLDLSAEEMQQQAVRFIAEEPLLFVRRASGRLARLFVPKTSPLQLVGGESAVSLFSPPALTLLVVANMQWAAVLTVGFAGLFCLGRFHRRAQILFAVVIVGSIPLCLIAISKPRYAFPFEPLLLLCAGVFALHLRDNWQYLSRRHRYSYAGLLLFFAWAWVAWGIFALSSRL